MHTSRSITLKETKVKMVNFAASSCQLIFFIKKTISNRNAIMNKISYTGLRYFLLLNKLVDLLSLNIFKLNNRQISPNSSTKFIKIWSI